MVLTWCSSDGHA